jgi:hypothetical protein
MRFLSLFTLSLLFLAGCDSHLVSIQADTPDTEEYEMEIVYRDTIVVSIGGLKDPGSFIYHNETFIGVSDIRYGHQGLTLWKLVNGQMEFVAQLLNNPEAYAPEFIIEGDTLTVYYTLFTPVACQWQSAGEIKRLRYDMNTGDIVDDNFNLNYPANAAQHVIDADIFENEGKRYLISGTHVFNDELERLNWSVSEAGTDNYGDPHWFNNPVAKDLEYLHGANGAAWVIEGPSYTTFSHSGGNTGELWFSESQLDTPQCLGTIEGIEMIGYDECGNPMYSMGTCNGELQYTGSIKFTNMDIIDGVPSLSKHSTRVLSRDDNLVNHGLYHPDVLSDGRVFANTRVEGLGWVIVEVIM